MPARLIACTKGRRSLCLTVRSTRVFLGRLPSPRHSREGVGRLKSERGASMPFPLPPDETSRRRSPASLSVLARQPAGHADRDRRWLAPLSSGASRSRSGCRIWTTRRYRRALSLLRRPVLAGRGTAEDRRGCLQSHGAVHDLPRPAGSGCSGRALVVARLPSLIAGTALVVLVFLWTRSGRRQPRGGHCGAAARAGPGSHQISQSPASTPCTACCSGLARSAPITW